MQLKPQHLESGTEGSLQLLYQSAFHMYPSVHVHRTPTHTRTHTSLSSLCPPPPKKYKYFAVVVYGLLIWLNWNTPDVQQQIELHACSPCQLLHFACPLCPIIPFFFFFLYTDFPWFSVTQIESSVPIGLGLCITFSDAMSKNDLSWV